MPIDRDFNYKIKVFKIFLNRTKTVKKIFNKYLVLRV
ncbi:hypothetical protein J2786_002390 [Chryseobacterium vietnamense]|uniref:Uncharacterized protein n=1 Tax=Chryseobacterium vietnamense TaxID=866785 RepID=A0ACC6J8R8_9FLAO|nr:hypothetical protein [Chryseobacterium vietnamense]